MAKFQSTMTRISFLLFPLLSISAAKFYCPENFPCLCTKSSVIPGEYQIYCSSNKSNESGFNVTIQPAKYVKIECQNSPDWKDFLPDRKLLNLGSVDSLVISGCELPSGEYNKTIVDHLSDIGWVKFLKIEGLKGKVKKQHFDVFPNLRTLVLSNNYLGRVDKNLLYGIHNLTKLDLRATQIRIPDRFFIKSRSLLDLDLSENLLAKWDLEVLEMFDGLESLRQLNLRRNQLQYISRDAFRKLPSLRFIDISESHLFDLDENLFEYNFKLTSVNMTANPFVRLPLAFFSNNQKLKFVQLEHNSIMLAKLMPRVFFGLPNLRVVSLEGLQLNELIGDLFWESSNIIELNLNKNFFTELHVLLLRDARELRKFSASSNKLRTLPVGFFAYTKKLMKLDLSKNQIAMLEKGFLTGLGTLLEINLEDNRLHFIDPHVFFSTVHLKIAKMARNQINFHSSHPINRLNISPFYYCSRLEVLDLSHNNICKMFHDWIVSHNHLRKLDLSYNNFSFVETKDLQFISNELYVDLSHNRITIANVTSMRYLSALQNNLRNVTINFNNNPIECYCEVYPLQHFAMDPTITEYVKLQLDNVKCSSPRELRGMRLKQLYNKKLECTWDNGRSSACVSDGICDCWIVPGNWTLHIDCAERKLKKEPVWINTWEDLYINVDLRGNELTKVPNMARNGYDKVEFLDLSNNLITRIDENLISPILQTLHLEYNNISSIDVNIMVNLMKSVNSLWLRGNPWLCDNSTSEFRKYVQNHKLDNIMDHFMVKCHNKEEKLWYQPINNLSDMCMAFLCCIFIIVLMFVMGYLMWVVFFVLLFKGCDIWDYVMYSICNYDTYVIYHDEVKNLVINEIAQGLANKPNRYKLYIRGRDYWRIFRNVRNTMQRMDRVIVVITQNFSTNQMEYQIACELGMQMIFIEIGGEGEEYKLRVNQLKNQNNQFMWINWRNANFWKSVFMAMLNTRN